jgi:hypothetical protein
MQAAPELHAIAVKGDVSGRLWVVQLTPFHRSTNGPGRSSEYPSTTHDVSEAHEIP